METSNDVHSKYLGTPETGSQPDNVPAKMASFSTKRTTLLSLPKEIRQHILCMATGDFCPFTRENAHFLATLPRNHFTRAEHVYESATYRSANAERILYAGLCKLTHINSIIRADMEWVERLWLIRRFATLNLAELAAYARAPTPINGILTLSIFDEAWLANPPYEFCDAVRSIYECDSSMGDIECNDYVQAWRDVIYSLPRDGAELLKIEAVEIFEVTKEDVVHGHKCRLWLKTSHLVRLQVVIARHLGLKLTRVRYAAAEIRRSGKILAWEGI